jgi:hypothetical protein
VRWTTTVWHLWDVATNKDAYEAALEWWDAIDQVREAEDNYLFVEDPAEAERLAAEMDVVMEEVDPWEEERMRGLEHET